MYHFHKKQDTLSRLAISRFIWAERGQLQSFLYLFEKKQFLRMKKSLVLVPKKTNFFQIEKNYQVKNIKYYKVKNINPQPLEVVIYILQVIKIMFHTILMKKLYTTRLF